MFLYNVKLFILYSFVKSSQVVEGGSPYENERSNEPLEFIRFQNHLQSPNYVEQRSNTTTEFSNTTAQTQDTNKQRKSRIWIHTFQIPSDWSKYLPNYRNEEQRLNTRTGSRGNLTEPFENVIKQSNGQTVDHAEQFQPTQEKQEFQNSPNNLAWSRDLQSSIHEEQKLRTTARLSSLQPPTQEQIKELREKMWIRSFQVLPVWSKHLKNHRNEGQSLSKRENPISLFKVSGNNSGTRKPSNINLPRIIPIYTLPLWPGENETEISSHIRYNRSDVPKSDFSYIQKPSGISGSRLGMAELSGLEGDNTNTSNISLMSYENTTKPSEEEGQKPWIHRSINYPGWSEDVPDYEYAKKNSNTTMKSLTLHPQTKSMGQKNWFVYSPTLPAWSGNEPNIGQNQQSLDTSTQVMESHGSKEISENPRVITRPIEVSKIVNFDSNKQNDESNIETNQKPMIKSGWNYLMSPEIQFKSPHKTKRVRSGENMRSVYGQELFEVEENSDNDPSLPVFIPV